MIDKFEGEYRFLSNFWPCVVEFEGMIYPSVEHAYVAAKTLNYSERLTIAEVPTAGQVKRLGRKLVLREDWEEIKLSVMEELVKKKFDVNWDLAQKLLDTGEQELVEGNTWGDVFWGECMGVGANHLGRILMNVRENLRDNLEISKDRVHHSL